jgi:hypothetical protein
LHNEVRSRFESALKRTSFRGSKLRILKCKPPKNRKMEKGCPGNIPPKRGRQHFMGSTWKARKALLNNNISISPRGWLGCSLNHWDFRGAARTSTRLHARRAARSREKVPSRAGGRGETRSPPSVVPSRFKNQCVVTLISGNVLPWWCFAVRSDEGTRVIGEQESRKPAVYIDFYFPRWASRLNFIVYERNNSTCT